MLTEKQITVLVVVFFFGGVFMNMAETWFKKDRASIPNNHVVVEMNDLMDGDNFFHIKPNPLGVAYIFTETLNLGKGVGYNHLGVEITSTANPVISSGANYSCNPNSLTGVFDWETEALLPKDSITSKSVTMGGFLGNTYIGNAALGAEAYPTKHNYNIAIGYKAGYSPVGIQEDGACNHEFSFMVAGNVVECLHCDYTYIER